MRADGTARLIRAATSACSRSIAARAAGRSASGGPSRSATSSTDGLVGVLAGRVDASVRGSATAAARRTRRPLYRRKILRGAVGDRRYTVRRADVAELVDAHGSGPCGGNPVEVQVLSSASATSALAVRMDAFATPN